MRLKIKHGFRLRSANRVLTPGMLFVTEDEAQIKELRDTYIPHGAAEEILAEQPGKTQPAPAETTVDGTDDISLVKGIGAKTAAKLAEKGITTKSGLKALVGDAEVKEILGANYEKVSEQLK